MVASATPDGAKPYRRGVGIALIDARGYVFVAQRIDTKEPAWQMPQGGMDDGETPRAAALRELLEEVGTDKVQIVATTRKWLRYDLPKKVQSKVWKGRFRGQEQKWFLMKFTGTDTDINIETDHPEFSSWKWIPFEKLPDVIVGFKKEIYTQVADAFAAKVGKIATTSSRSKRAAAQSRVRKHR